MHRWSNTLSISHFLPSHKLWYHISFSPKFTFFFEFDWHELIDFFRYLPHGENGAVWGQLLVSFFVYSIPVFVESDGRFSSPAYHNRFNPEVGAKHGNTAKLWWRRNPPFTGLPTDRQLPPTRHLAGRMCQQVAPIHRKRRPTDLH